MYKKVKLSTVSELEKWICHVNIGALQWQLNGLKTIYLKLINASICSSLKIKQIKNGKYIYYI